MSLKKSSECYTEEIRELIVIKPNDFTFAGLYFPCKKMLPLKVYTKANFIA